MVNAAPWFVIHTRPTREIFAREALLYKGYEVFLPTYRKAYGPVKRDCPLFPGYAFFRCSSGVLGKVITTPGVIRIVSFGRQPAVIPEEDIARIRTIIGSPMPYQPWRYLVDGTVVQVDDGPLKGLEGVLLKNNNGRPRLVISITILQRSTAVVMDENTSVTVVSIPRAVSWP